MKRNTLKHIAALLTAGLMSVTVLSPSVWAEDTQATAGSAAAEDAEATGESAESEETELAPENQEGYVEEADGCYYVVSWCTGREENDYRNIYGEFCFPEDYEEGEQYPVVIYCHQNMGSHKSFKNPGWLADLAQEGYIGYCFDFCGGTTANCLSDLDYEDSTDETQVSDINAVIEFVKEQTFCDTDNIYLLGGSRGGRDVALAAPSHNDDIAAIILLYGAVSDEEALEQASGYTGDALLIHGINDESVPYTASVDMLNTIYSESNSELLLLSGPNAVHSFDGVHPELRAVAESKVLNFLDRHVAASEESEEE
ncbi:MAG: alpha/beta fold hydrolase [Clostridiales bacterium]|nr:alpha/beta fold hydrolase [Clostridiales bacterium]